MASRGCGILVHCSHSLLDELSQLDSLDLSGNHLRDVPPVLAQLRLEVLNLSHNQLTDLHLERGHLKNLRQLDLSHNQFSVMPAALSHLPPCGPWTCAATLGPFARYPCPGRSTGMSFRRLTIG